MRLIVFYAACFLISIVLLIWYMYTQEKSTNQLMYMIFFAAVSNGGFLALALSKTLEEALLANKLTYLNGCFIPMCAFLVTCDLCKVKIHRYAVAAMYSVQTVLFLCVCSIGYADIYYKSAELHINGHVGYLTKTYGVAHAFYPLTLYGYMVAAFAVLGVSFARKNSVSYRTVLLILTNYIVLVGAYTAERALHFSVELMPFMCTFSFVVICVTANRSEVYSVSRNLYRMLSRDQAGGYICFDKKLRFMGCSDSAAAIIPELRRLRLDRPIAYAEDIAYHRIKPVLEQYAKTGAQTSSICKIGGKSYEIKVNPLCRESGAANGYMVELADATEHQRYLEMIEGYNRNLESEVDGKTHKIREMQGKIILGMAQMVESRDTSTGGHIKRTSAVVKVFARQLLKEDMGFSQEFLYYVEKSAPMHDLGKIAVDDAILRKQGRFEDWEYAIMKTHSAAGAKIVRDILTGVETEDFVRIAVNVAHYHHEKVDGNGYPDGLVGEDIPREARIMALADVFDALVSKRCYKEAFSYDRAFAIIEESIGTHFDETLGRVFLKCRRELESLYDGFISEESERAAG